MGRRRPVLGICAWLALQPFVADPLHAANAASGRQKALAACATCHGGLGISALPNAPHLAGQPQIYLVEQLKRYRSGKRPDEVMGVIAKPLTDEDIEDLAAWFSSIAIEAKPAQ